jgi:hypothetical protein
MERADSLSGKMRNDQTDKTDHPGATHADRNEAGDEKQ